LHWNTLCKMQMRKPRGQMEHMNPFLSVGTSLILKMLGCVDE